jgi:hypothetical protein
MLIPMVVTYGSPERITGVTVAEPSVLRSDETINPSWPRCSRNVYAHEPVELPAQPGLPAEPEQPAEPDVTLASDERAGDAATPPENTTLPEVSAPAP